MHKLFSFLCFFLLFATILQAKTIPQSVLDGFFQGRSSPVVVAPKTISEGDSVLFLKTPSEAYKSDSIKDKDVADLITHLMGTSPLKIDSPRTQFPQTNVFESPRANLLVVFDSLGEDTASQFSSFGQKIALKHTSFPRNSLSKLTTISTGVSPSVHGIVSSSWSHGGQQVDAFSPEGQSAALNLADILNSNFHGVSRIVVISADRQMASALAPQLDTLNFHPSWNNHVVHWNKDKKTSEYVSGKRPELSIDESMILKSLKSSSPFGIEKCSIKFNQDQSATIQIEDLSARFHLNKEQELTFLAELELVYHLFAQLNAQGQVRNIEDDSPDYYAVVFSSIRPLISQHGADSDVVKVAIRLAHSSINQLMEAVKTQYDSRVVNQVVYLGSSDGTEKDHPYIKEVTPELLSQLSSEQEVHTLSTSIHHHTLRSTHEYDFYLASTDNNTNSTNSTKWYSKDDVASLQIPLWVTIAWVLITIAFVYAMGNVSSGRDTLLYAAGSRPHAN